MGWVALQAPDTLCMVMTDLGAGVLVQGTVAGTGGLAVGFREKVPGSAVQREEEPGWVVLGGRFLPACPGKVSLATESARAVVELCMLVTFD